MLTSRWQAGHDTWRRATWGLVHRGMEGWGVVQGGMAAGGVVHGDAASGVGLLLASSTWLQYDLQSTYHAY